MEDKLDLLWTAKEIGAEINRTAPQTHYMLERGLIRSARQVGKRWVAERQALREEFSSPAKSKGGDPA